MNATRTVLFYFTLVISTTVTAVMTITLTALTGNANLSHRCAMFWGLVNLWVAGVHVEVEGMDRIDPDRPYIYMANHQSWFDIFALLGKLPVQFRWLAKEELFRVPVLGQAMRASGYIPVNRTDRKKSMASLSVAAEIIARGASVVIFPEGTRCVDGRLQEFKKGGFLLALKSKQPIVPVSISKSFRVLSKGGSIGVHPGTIRVTVGVPIPTAGKTTRQRNALMTQVREAILENLSDEERGLEPEGVSPARLGRVPA